MLLSLLTLRLYHYDCMCVHLSVSVEHCSSMTFVDCEWFLLHKRQERVLRDPRTCVVCAQASGNLGKIASCPSLTHCKREAIYLILRMTEYINWKVLVVGFSYVLIIHNFVLLIDRYPKSRKNDIYLSSLKGYFNKYYVITFG